MRRYDGAPNGSNVPKYQIEASGTLTPSDRAAPDVKIYITDFGEAFFDQPSSGAPPPTQLNTPDLVKPLEAIFGCPITFAADIWTLGLLMFEILGRHPLFEAYFPSEDTVLAEAMSALGPLPGKWWQAWPDRSKFFKEDGSLQGGQGISREDLTERLRDSVGLKADSVGYGFDESEMGSFEELLRSMLRYEPLDRVTVDEALKSGWVRKYGMPALEKVFPDIGLSCQGVPQHIGEKEEASLSVTEIEKI